MQLAIELATSREHGVVRPLHAIELVCPEDSYHKHNKLGIGEKKFCLRKYVYCISMKEGVVFVPCREQFLVPGSSLKVFLWERGSFSEEPSVNGLTWLNVVGHTSAFSPEH